MLAFRGLSRWMKRENLEKTNLGWATITLPHADARNRSQTASVASPLIQFIKMHRLEINYMYMNYIILSGKAVTQILLRYSQNIASKRKMQRTEFYTTLFLIL